ncbi:MAG: hypothetical protein NTY70_16600 [Burkholderiales bacterium]|nr:hypothetical protein [Burkholderiales bacterium]
MASIRTPLHSQSDLPDAPFTSMSCESASNSAPNFSQRDQAYYRAVLSKDSRFDGVFFTGVTTTGIYLPCGAV